MNTRHFKQSYFWLLTAGLTLTLITVAELTLPTQAYTKLPTGTPLPQILSSVIPPENPLTNPGFEGDWQHSPCDRYDAYGNFVDQVNPGEIFTPQGWTTFFKNGLPVQHDPNNQVGWAQPEVKVINNEPPFVDPPRIHSGERAVQLFTFWKIHDAGLYQQVNVNSGGRWRLSAWVHAWTSEEHDPYHSQCDPWQAWQMVGIDPTGGANPYAASVVWSESAHIYDVYTQTHSVEATAQASVITVFIRSWVKWPIIHNDMHWDDVSLELITPPNMLYLPFVARSWENIPTPAGKHANFGVVFVNPAEPGTLVDEGRYQKAAELGVAWDRWPLYWYNVELTAGQFDWTPYDQIVEADLNHGLQINAILLGTPGFYANGVLTAPTPTPGAFRWPNTPDAISMSPPTGLYEPVFADGSDTPAPGQAINPNNPWARVVYLAVDRYRPGGTLAVQNNWPDDWGVRVWEVWNEPDLALFWSGSVADYARLLKVAALSIRQADPNATVMVGGLANPPAPGYLADLLLQITQDPDQTLLTAQGWYFDAVALHNYGWSEETKNRLIQARALLDAYQAQYDAFGPKAMWLNESGAPVWNDYPGPTWQQNGEANHMATMTEQSAFILQNAVYALYHDAKVVFHFQLYDGCGNDPPGTDFPPNRLDLCDQGLVCASASAFGLWRNQTSDSCYRQHPQPDTARPAFTALDTIALALTGAQPISYQRPSDDWEWFTFHRAATKERITIAWARQHHNVSVQIPAVAHQATLLDQTGVTTTIQPTNGVYNLILAAATNRNEPHPPDGSASIGGPPYILIEPWE